MPNGRRAASFERGFGSNRVWADKRGYEGRERISLGLGPVGVNRLKGEGKGKNARKARKNLNVKVPVVSEKKTGLGCPAEARVSPSYPNMVDSLRFRLRISFRESLRRCFMRKKRDGSASTPNSFSSGQLSWSGGSSVRSQSGAYAGPETASGPKRKIRGYAEAGLTYVRGSRPTYNSRVPGRRISTGVDSRHRTCQR